MAEDLHHLAAAYALDALEPAERRAFESHYPSCAICSAEVVDYRAVAASLGAAASSAPPAHLRQSVLDEIGRTRQISPLVPERVVDLAARRRRTTGVLLAAIAAAAVLFAGFVSLRSPGDDGTADELVALMSAPDVAVDELVATSAGPTDPQGSIRVVWSAERDEVAVFASGLDDPGDGLAYALWMLDAEGSPIASVLFRPDGQGVADGLGSLPGAPGGWGVTIEPEGGSDQPSGEILYLTA